MIASAACSVCFWARATAALAAARLRLPPRRVAAFAASSSLSRNTMIRCHVSSACAYLRSAWSAVAYSASVSVRSSSW